MENPRQTPSYRYSERYGPSPPCFARATLAALSPDDEEYLTVRLDGAALLLDMWIAPGGKFVKGEVSNPPTVIYAGRTILPGADSDESTDP